MTVPRVPCYRLLLLLLLNATGAVALLACDSGCPENTTLKNGLCLQRRDVDAGSRDSNSRGNESATTGSPPATNGGAGHSMSELPGTGTMQSGAIGTAGISGGNLSSQAGSGTGQAGPQPSQPGAASTAGAGATSATMQSASTAAGAGANASAAGTSGSACTPTAETCDNLDNDCDSMIDEEVAPMPCGPDKGICKPGVIHCRAGKWDDPETQCEGATGPSPTGEQCDTERLDENCNGVANEGCQCNEGESMPCSTGKYTCKKGTASCINGKFASECQGEVQGAAETCDGMDNDCDGKPDNGGDSLCPGGRHCAGDAGCVDCTTDDACRAKSDACNVGYCDLSRHQCGARAKADHTSCSGSGSSGVCRSGTCFNGCIDATDCNESSKEQCQQGRCVVPIVCGNGKSEAGEECDDGNQSNNDNCLNTCKIAKCGDGYLNQSIGVRNEPVEACDPSAGGSTFDCDAKNCQRIYVYTPCNAQGANSADCGGSGYCSSGICLPPCTKPSNPVTMDAYECSIPNGRVGHCYGGCAMRCDIANEVSCPVGASCKESTVPAGNGSYMKFCLP